MWTLTARENVQRIRRKGAHERVTFVELFFDLVFVFAVTQLSHTLLHHFTIQGAAETLLLFLAVWWVWIFTQWVTNWLDPEKGPVRLMLFALMLAGLVMSTSIPRAFEDRGLPFGLAIAAAQVGRSLFMLWALARHNRSNHRNFVRISAWLSVSGLCWIAGGLAHESLRFELWLVALAIEYAGPFSGFWIPMIGRTRTSEWDVEGGHMAERCALFLIIALGESILVTGATFADLTWTGPTVGAFLAAFVGSVAMWWIYFDMGAERGSRYISASSDPGRLARLAYTYLHLILIAGIILTAVADEMALAHPTGAVDLKAAIAILGGPALYLVGNAAFKRVSAPRTPLSHLVGLGLLALLAPAAAMLSALALSLATTVVLIVVAVWERRSLAADAEPQAAVG